MTESQISVETGIPLKEIEASLASAYNSLIESGISLEQLKDFARKEKGGN